MMMELKAQNHVKCIENQVVNRVGKGIKNYKARTKYYLNTRVPMFNEGE